MASEGRGDHIGEGGEGSGSTHHVHWTPAMSSFMLSFLSNLVVSGTRTSSTFKRVHLNQCAKALNDCFKRRLTAENIKNHLRTWHRKYGKISQVRMVSGTGWDEKDCIITMDDEHYVSHTKDHKGDAEYLNKPLQHYNEMLTIFGSSMASGKYAKGSSEPLGLEDDEIDQYEVNMIAAAVSNEENGATSASKPKRHEESGTTSSATKSKKNKTSQNEDQGLIEAFKAVGERISIAIEKAGIGNNYIPDDLFETLQGLPGFDETHISYYYSHLVDHPHKARAFYSLPFGHKISWLAKFVSETFP